MKPIIALATIIPLLAGCAPSGPDVAGTFKDLKQDQMEIRMGYLPELGDVKCDRNMYAGFRTAQTEAITFNIKMVVMQPGASMERYERQLTLAPGKQKGWLSGATRLFPAPLETSCGNVNVKMTTMHCTYGPNKRRARLPKNH